MNYLRHLFLVVMGLFIMSCSDDATLRKKAYDLAHKFIITDGHIDVPWRLNDGYEDLSVRTDGGDFDYVRAKEGGLDAPFMSIYVPSSYQETGGAKEKADSLIELVHRIANDHPDKFEVAFSVSDVNRIFGDGKIALPMGMENGAPILDDLSNVKYFYDRGIRYITLTHAKDNLICDSSYDTTNTWGGLSPFGRKVVKEMNRVGIMVDISHVTDEVINQVMDMTDVPVIASHSSCRFFTPGWERNMGDDEIKRLKDNGGVIQINYGSSFVTKASQDKRNANNDKILSYAKENDLAEGDEELEKYAKEVNTNNPFYADITEVVDHIDHVVKLAGIDHVGIGSDYDGVGDSLPYGLKDASSYPNLIYHLLKRGYTEDEIEKICYKNIWRVWSAVEAAAKS
jgi:membrane dipeptidase